MRPETEQMVRGARSRPRHLLHQRSLRLSQPSFLLSTALTSLRAADVTNERLLNPQREPQNWILHHGNYEGHRFSLQSKSASPHRDENSAVGT
jgi:hypothetical protein